MFGRAKYLRTVERGTIRVLPGRPPDHIAQKVLREQVEATGPPLRPYIADAMVYSTRLGAVDRAIGVWEPDARRLVYLVVMHYAYRDYRGRKHRDPQESIYSVVDARTLAPLGGGGADNLHLRRFGRSVALEI